MLKEIVSPLVGYGVTNLTRTLVPMPDLRNYVLQKLQLYQIRKLVTYAFHNSRFFHDYYSQHGINESDIPDLNPWDLPIINREQMNSENKKEISAPYSNEEWAKMLSYLFLTSSHFSVKNKKEIKIAVVYDEKHDSRQRYFNEMLSNSLQECGYNVKFYSDIESAEQIVSEINAFSPHEIIGDAKTLLFLEKSQSHINQHYCIPECMCIAMKKASHRYFEMFPQCSYVEVLDDNNAHVKPGEIGWLVVTNFLNYTQPFIRYKVGSKVQFDLNENQEPCILDIISEK